MKKKNSVFNSQQNYNKILLVSPDVKNQLIQEPNINMQLFVSFVVSLAVLQAAGRVQYETKLLKCSKCPPGWGVVGKCTQQKDTVCEKCENGKSYSPHYSSKSACWLCSRCGIGLYEAHRCSPHRDTICNECITFIGQKNFIKRNDFYKKCSYLFIDQHKSREVLTDNLDLTQQHLLENKA